VQYSSVSPAVKAERPKSSGIATGAHTNITGLADSPGYSYTCSGENTGITKVCYLKLLCQFSIRKAPLPLPPPPHFRAHPADKPHTSLQHSPPQLSRDLVLCLRMERFY